MVKDVVLFFVVERGGRAQMSSVLSLKYSGAQMGYGPMTQYQVPQRVAILGLEGI
jgi:hypothetical protein